MGFRINNNITALIAQGNLLKTQNSLTTSIERLSSGLRINRGADDAAGLTISEKLRGQIKGLNRAVLNAQDGISLIQTAEGALNENASILNRIRELTIQASNDTLTTNDRLEIQKEIDQLVEEVDRVAFTTEFNTKKLLDGTASSIVSVNEDGLDGIQVGSTRHSSGNYSVELYLASMGNRQEMASNIMRTNDGNLITRDTKLGEIASFFDNEGNNVLRNPIEFTIRGNSQNTSITLSSDVSVGEFVSKMKEAITKDSKYGGLGIKGTDVSFNAKTGQITIRSGREGSSGDIAFSSDENLIKAFGFQESVPSKDPAYRAQAIQQGVADPIKTSTSTTTNRFSGIIPGIDLQFQPPTAAMVEGTIPPVDVIQTGDEDILFKFADTNASEDETNRTHYVNVTLKANTSYSLTSIQEIINYNIKTGVDKITGTSFVDNVNYPNGYYPPNIRAGFRGGSLVLSSGLGGSSSSISLYDVSSSATNVLGVQNGVFLGKDGNVARITGSKNVSNGVNIGSSSLVISIKGPDGKGTGNAAGDRIEFPARANVSATSLLAVINNQLRLKDIRAEASIDANGSLILESLEDGEDTALVITQITGNVTDLGFVNGSAASGRGGISAEFVGKTNESFSDFGFTLNSTTAFELIDQFGASSGDIVLGVGTSIGVPIATQNNITVSSTSIALLLNQSDLSTTDIGFEFDNGGMLRFFSKSVGKDSRILLTSKNPNTVLNGDPANDAVFTAATSATTILSTFGIEGSQAVQGSGQTKFSVHVSDRSFTLQIGANENQVMESSIANFSANALGIVGLDVTSLASARKALAAVDIAVNKVSSERSKLGSLQNRLTSTINNLTVTSTNLQAAESRIRDVDVAMETVSFTRNQILIQSGTAQLAQANALPQQALQLLGG
jgi:flagellin